MLTRFLGGYPRLGVHDPALYVTAMKAAFSEYPEWAGEEACRRLKVLDPERVPSEGRCRKVLEEIVRLARYAAGFDREGRLLLTDRAEEGRRARLPATRHNLLVRPGRPGYEAMCERAKLAAPGDFEHATEGIWVPFDWWEGRRGAVAASSRIAEPPPIAARAELDDEVPF